MNFPSEVLHGCRFKDDVYDYKTVTLTMAMYMRLPRNKSRALTLDELRDLRIEQSEGWEHYHSLPHEPHILMLRKKRVLKPTN